MSSLAPGQISRPQRLLREGMLTSAVRCPDQTALIIEGQEYSYAELLHAVQCLATALIQEGVRRGDRIAVFMDNTWPCIVSIYAALLAGGVFLVINPQTKAEKLRYILQNSGARILLTDAHLAGQFTKAIVGLENLGTIISSGDISVIPSVQIPLYSFDQTITQNAPLAEAVPVIPNDLAALIYTSGSTGRPKGVMQTHQAMVFVVWSLIEYLRLSVDERILLVLPLAFDYGLYQLFMAMKLGATLVVERSFTFPGQIYQVMRRQRVTVFPGVPTIFATMIAGHKRKGLSFPGVRRVTNTAAALAPDTIPYLQEIFPQALIFKMYGLTECKRVSYLEPELLAAKPASVGRPIPGTEVFLLSPEGDPVALGEPGILHVRGPHIMAGYWQQPELTEQVLRPGPLPGERILCTGDWFRMDADGCLYFCGRTDDIIKTRGEKVSPLEVEQVLRSIDGVTEAVVLGIPDNHLGTALCAFVVPEEGCCLEERRLRKFCMARLENFMVPRDIVLVERLPLSANGKVDKNALLTSYYPEAV